LFQQLQPPMIDPIQSIPASAEGASDLVGTELAIIDESIPSPDSPIQSSVNTNLDEQSILPNLESHYLGELPRYVSNSQTTSDMASDEVMTDSPHQQQPNQEINHITIPESISDQVLVPESTLVVSKPAVPEQSVTELSASDHNESDQTTNDQSTTNTVNESETIT